MAPTEQHVADTDRRPRRARLFAIVALVVLALDLLSKVLVVSKLDGHDPVRLLGGAIYLDVARNSGAAFSLGTGFTVILSAVALGVVAVIVRTASRMHSVGWAIALGLILGGALGNLSDRIFRAPGVFRGHVVDWISVFGPNAERWPIFNVADSAIVCGAILVAALSLFGVPFDRSARRATDPEPPSRPSAQPPSQPPGQPATQTSDGDDQANSETSGETPNRPGERG